MPVFSAIWSIDSWSLTERTIFCYRMSPLIGNALAIIRMAFAMSGSPGQMVGASRHSSSSALPPPTQRAADQI